MTLNHAPRPLSGSQNADRGECISVTDASLVAVAGLPERRACTLSVLSGNSRHNAVG